MKINKEEREETKEREKVAPVTLLNASGTTSSYQ